MSLKRTCAFPRPTFTTTPRLKPSSIGPSKPAPARTVSPTLRLCPVQSTMPSAALTRLFLTAPADGPRVSLTVAPAASARARTPATLTGGPVPVAIARSGPTAAVSAPAAITAVRAAMGRKSNRPIPAGSLMCPHEDGRSTSRRLTHRTSRRPASAALEGGLLLLQERLGGAHVVRGLRAGLLQLGLLGERAGQVARGGVLQRRLDRPVGLGRARGEPGGQVPRRRVELLGRDDAVHETELQRLGRAYG